jgi:hypothetical protein
MTGETMNRVDQTYLGDGVYVEADRGVVKLTTENGVATTNTIILESEVLDALLRWVEYNKATKILGVL